MQFTARRLYHVTLHSVVIITI